MGQRVYHYVAPSDVRESALSHSPVGIAIRSGEELVAWLALQAADRERDGSLIAKFVISLKRRLLLAPRRLEHVTCSGGVAVLSAGEITFASDGTVSDISNHSTGFCPEPESWSAVAAALDAIPI